MDVRQLEAFLAVVDHGSFSAAAEALFTVQSNVSSHVARLETEVGSSLIDRRTRQLTPAGLAVERRGREALRQLGAIPDELASLENRIIGTVACGTTPSVGLWVLPDALVAARRHLPEVTVTVVEAQSDALVLRILNGDLDIAITTGVTNNDVVSLPLFDEDIVAVLAPDHPLATAESVGLDDLAKVNLLLPLPDNPLSRHIVTAFDREQLTLQSGLEVGSSALVGAMAVAGLGVAMVPASAYQVEANRAGVRKPIEGLGPREVALTRRASAPPNRAANGMWSLLATAAVDAARQRPGCNVRENALGSVANGSDPDPGVIGMDR